MHKGSNWLSILTVNLRRLVQSTAIAAHIRLAGIIDEEQNEE
jgi:hypothetical protein